MVNLRTFLCLFMLGALWVSVPVLGMDPFEFRASAIEGASQGTPTPTPRPDLGAAIANTLQASFNGSIQDPATQEALKGTLSAAISSPQTQQAATVVLVNSLTHEQTQRMATGAVSDALADPRTERLLTNSLSGAIKNNIPVLAGYAAIFGGCYWMCNGFCNAYDNYTEIRKKSHNCVTATLKALCNRQMLGGLTSCVVGLLSMWYGRTLYGA